MTNHSDPAAWAAQLNAIVAGSEIALAGLYAGTSGKVYGYALRMVRVPADAAEVTVDVYLQVWRNARSYDAERGCVLTWLLAICRHRAIDAIRRRDPATTHPDPHLLSLLEGVEDESPEVLALQAEQRQYVRQAVCTLAPVQRQLLSLAYFRGLTHAEIARQSGIPLGTVKSHVRRAVMALRPAMDPSARLRGSQLL